MKSCLLFIRIALLTAFGFVGQLNASAGTNELNFIQLDDRLKAIIKDAHSSDRDLLEAINHMGKPKENPAFWTQIADNTNYTQLHRARCVLALFRRHISSEVDMGEIAMDISPANWLVNSEIVKLDPKVDEWPAGNFDPPVEINDGESVFRINVLNSYQHIYFRFKGDISLEKFKSELKPTQHQQNYVEVPQKQAQKQNLIVAQLAFDDDYEVWY